MGLLMDDSLVVQIKQLQTRLDSLVVLLICIKELIRSDDFTAEEKVRTIDDLLVQRHARDWKEPACRP